MPVLLAQVEPVAQRRLPQPRLDRSRLLSQPQRRGLARVGREEQHGEVIGDGNGRLQWGDGCGAGARRRLGREQVIEERRLILVTAHDTAQHAHQRHQRGLAGGLEGALLL